MRRPASVTIVGALLIVLALFTIGGAIFAALRGTTTDPAVAAIVRRATRLPPGIAGIVGDAVALGDGIAGALILRRRLSGRRLYVAVAGAGLLFAVADTRIIGFVVMQALIYALFVFLLFRPAATLWFRGGDA